MIFGFYFDELIANALILDLERGNPILQLLAQQLPLVGTLCGIVLPIDHVPKPLAKRFVLRQELLGKLRSSLEDREDGFAALVFRIFTLLVLGVVGIAGHADPLRFARFNSPGATPN